MKRKTKCTELPQGKNRDCKNKFQVLPLIPPAFSILLIALLFLLPGCEEDNEKKEEIESFHNDITNVVDATTEFVENAVVYESSRFDILSPEEINTVFENYILAGENFIEYMEKVQGNSHNTKGILNEPVVECVSAVSGFFDVSGISPGMVKDLGDLIRDTRDTVAALNTALQQGIIDDDQYTNLMNNVRTNKPLDAVGIGFSSIMGAGAGAFTTLACGAAGVATLPALVTVGVVGGTVGYGTYRIWSWYRGGTKSDEFIYISSATATLGEPIPSTLFADGASMVIAIDGYAPVLIENYPYPDTGNLMTIEIDGEKLSDLKSSDYPANLKNSDNVTEVCFIQELATGNDCNEITFVSGYATPQSPAPGQNVSVTGSVMPVVEGCEIHFSIIGTDGYTSSGTYNTNAQGQANFGIPGAAPGVIDKVTIQTANGASYVVTYVFSESKETSASGSGKNNFRIQR